MSTKLERVGWIGAGRMGYPMAERLLDAQVPVTIWNRTRSKAEPLATKGAHIASGVAELASLDVVFCILATAADLESVLFGDQGLLSGPQQPSVIVDCSTIGLGESAAIRSKLSAKGIAFIAAPVSGNGKVVASGQLSAILSGPAAAFEKAQPNMQIIAAKGVSYAGEGDVARICKIAHNVMLGIVAQALYETTLLAQQAGVPRSAFLEFLNNSVMGSLFTRYKTPSLVNLDWTPTFTSTLLRKDLDLGLQLAHDSHLSLPITAATRELVQAHIGLGHGELDFASMLQTMASFAGLSLQSEDKG